MCHKTLRCTAEPETTTCQFIFPLSTLPDWNSLESLLQKFVSGAIYVSAWNCFIIIKTKCSQHRWLSCNCKSHIQQKKFEMLYYLQKFIGWRISWKGKCYKNVSFQLLFQENSSIINRALSKMLYPASEFGTWEIIKCDSDLSIFCFGCNSPIKVSVWSQLKIKLRCMD